ncbi:transposase [Saccharicrinis sp. FJH54]|uniref:transposase n=1 Tax=Saccharicrinis sp. FJH54 TaxID=3344665 RepID=UPI0035D4D3CA
MSDKFQEYYRIPSNRLQNWDYGSLGKYFITICTKHRECSLGKIENNTFISSSEGNIVANIWHKIPEKFPFADIDEFIVMPNHIHGIIQIKCRSVATENVFVETPIHRVSDNGKRGGITGNTNPMLYQNLSRIIRWFKGSITFEIHKFNCDFAWQSRFHDHIIRNESEYYRIRNYIKENVKNWKADEHNK